MIQRCKNAGLTEPEFSLTDGFVTIIRRKLKVVSKQPELQPESLELRVLKILDNNPLSKSEISEKLNQKTISGHLNKLMKSFIIDKTVEYTIPKTPKSPLQKYRLTKKRRALLAKLKL